jgi:glycosyltransferase involved in cell wall biosynthesis
VNKAVLLPNIGGFPSESMRRYATELGGALRSLPEKSWTFDEVACEPEAWVSRRFGESMASRHARFWKYPSLIRARGEASVFHILDHSHANLALATPPEKTVLTCHDIIPLMAARGLIPMQADRFAAYTFPLRLQCMKRCKKILAISRSTKQNLVEIGGIPAEKIEVVYYGCNPAFGPNPYVPGMSPSEERRGVLEKFGIPPDAAVVLHVATATRYKNSPAILRALRILKDTSAGEREVWLLRVGADFFPDEKALAAELGVEDRIRKTGKIFDDQVLGACYRSADVFAFPSLWEGFGWPVLEAMNCGTPVVVSNVASLPEVAGSAGLAVPPRDHAALAESLRVVLTSPSERSRLSALALEQAGRFSWEKCARDTLAVYQKIAD